MFRVQKVIHMGTVEVSTIVKEEVKIVFKGEWILVTKTLEYGRQAEAAKQLSSFIYLETEESNGVKARS